MRSSAWAARRLRSTLGATTRIWSTNCKTVVTQKPDAVIQTLGTLSVIDPWLKRISKANIPLFTIDAPSQYSLNNTTSDNVATGKALAGQLIKDVGGKGNILVFNGFYGVPVCAIRYDQLKLRSRITQS